MTLSCHEPCASHFLFVENLLSRFRVTFEDMGETSRSLWNTSFLHARHIRGFGKTSREDLQIPRFRAKTERLWARVVPSRGWLHSMRGYANTSRSEWNTSFLPCRAHARICQNLPDSVEYLLFCLQATFEDLAKTFCVDKTCEVNYAQPCHTKPNRKHGVGWRHHSGVQVG